MKTFYFFFSLVVALALVTPGYAQNSTVSVQGVLRDPTGHSVADATYSILFKLYNVATGGSQLWEETQANVQVTNGVFFVKLGSVAALPAIDATQQYYLGFTVAGGTELTPRIELSKSLSAMTSLSVTGETNVMPSSGNVGIGTRTPNSKLEVNGDIRLTSGSTGKLYFPDGTSISTADMGGSASSLSNLNDAPITADGNNDGSGRIVFNTGATERMRIENNGEVLVGSATKGIKMFNWGNYVDLQSVGTKLSLNHAGNDVISNVTGGNFGIGTVNPGEKLDVAGNIIHQGADFRFGTNDGRPIGTKTLQRAFVHDVSDMLMINFDGDFEGGSSIGGAGSSNLFVSGTTNGNVGIGTTTPSQKLEVYNGKMLVNGDGGGDAGSGATLSITSSNTNKPYVSVTNAGNGSLSIGADQDAAIIGWDANAQNLVLRRNITYGSFPNTGTTAMTILGTNGNVGIGVTNPSNKLSVAGTINGDAFIAGNDAKLLDINVGNALGIQGLYDPAWGGIKLGNAGPTVWGSTNWLEMSNLSTAKIWGTDAGRTAFQIGNTTGLARIWEISVGGANNPGPQGGNGGFYIYDVSAGANRMFIDVGGNIFRNDGQMFWNVGSDQRVKKDITPYKSGLELIQQLNPVKFKYNGRGATTDDGKEHVSFIAQEIEQIPELAPLMVSKSNMKLEEADASETEVLSLNLSALQFVLVNAIKELKAENDAMMNEIEQLKALIQKSVPPNDKKQ